MDLLSQSYILSFHGMQILFPSRYGEDAFNLLVLDYHDISFCIPVMIKSFNEHFVKLLYKCLFRFAFNVTEFVFKTRRITSDMVLF